MKKSIHALYCLPLLLWIILTMFSQICRASADSASSSEYALKAVCLYNFSHFTRWPGTKNISQSETIVIGVVGHTPFSDALDELQASIRKTQKKNITLVHHGPYRKGMDLRGSHLLFVSSSEKNKMRSIISGLEKAPVLTVSDTAGFLEAGGMITLVIRDNKVRWEINRTAIKQSGLGISANLLQLAIRIENFPDQSDLQHHKLDRKYPSLPLQKALASMPRRSLSTFNLGGVYSFRDSHWQLLKK